MLGKPVDTFMTCKYINNTIRSYDRDKSKEVKRGTWMWLHRWRHGDLTGLGKGSCCGCTGLFCCLTSIVCHFLLLFKFVLIWTTHFI